MLTPGFLTGRQVLTFEAAIDALINNLTSPVIIKPKDPAPVAVSHKRHISSVAKTSANDSSIHLFTTLIFETPTKVNAMVLASPDSSSFVILNSSVRFINCYIHAALLIPFPFDVTPHCFLMYCLQVDEVMQKIAMTSPTTLGTVLTVGGAQLPCGSSVGITAATGDRIRLSCEDSIAYLVSGDA